MQNFQDTFEIRKRSFISTFSICMTVSLNLLELDGKISKSSEVIGKSHWNRWSDIADSLASLIRFPVKFEVLMYLHALVKKCQNVFP